MLRANKIIYFLTTIKKIKVSAETFAKNCVHNIIDKKKAVAKK